MKTILDFLMDNREFKDYIGNLEVSLEQNFGCVVMCVNGEVYYYIEAENPLAFQEQIQDILDDNHKTEVRFCEQCGKPYDAGFTAGNGEWYCCEECFEKTMDEDYGKGKWRPSAEEGEYEGWYEYLNEDGVWEDTGVFYTEWN